MRHLEIAASCHKPEIIGITEIQPKNTAMKLNTVDVKLTGFNVFGNFGKDGRGVAIYISDQLYTQNYEPAVEYRDSVWVDIISKDSANIRVGCIYRSDSNDELTNISLLEHLQDVVDHTPRSMELLIMGDFNHRGIDWANLSCADDSRKKSQAFLDKILDIELTQHVVEPTRIRHGQRPSVIDLVLTKTPEIVDTVFHDSPLGNSDHMILTFDVVTNFKRSQENKQIHERFLYEKGNFESFRRDFCAENLVDKLKDLNASDGWDVLSGTIRDLTEKHVPKRKVGPNTRRNFKPLWENPKALARVKAKKRAWSRYLQTKSGEDYQIYIQERDSARKEVKKAVKNFERTLAKKSKTDPKAFWRYAKSKTGTKMQVQQLRHGDKLVFSDNEKVEILNDFFSSVYTVEDHESMPDLPFDENTPIINDPIIPKELVLKKLKQINVNKAPGPDGVPGIVLKNLADVIAEPLAIMFQKSVDTGELPKEWKTANVSPIYKKGDKTLASNYRPVSLTSVTCKILESILRDHIDSHLTSNGLASNLQYGFTSGKSTKSKLIDCAEELTKALDEGKGIDVIYLDFRKAFDSVPYKRLLLKLNYYGVTGKTNKWIENFLSDRTQSVVINGVRSRTSHVTSGVPQGSVLGPTLFKIFVNDLPEQAKEGVLPMFADDGKLYKVIQTIDDCDSLQADLRSCGKWSKDWQLGYNELKCVVLRLGRNLPDYTYKMMDDKGRPIELEQVSQTSDLGLLISNTLETRYHVDKITASANRALFSIKRSLQYMNKYSGPLLYKSLVRPIMEYGNGAWTPLWLYESRKMEKVQRRATRWILRQPGLSYPERLRKLEMPSLFYRRQRGDLIEIYKYFKNPNAYNNFRLEKSE